MSSVRVRFPPSPTGLCHVGTARMAVLNYLFAKKNGGTIFFRSEDTDKERSKPEYEEDIKEQLMWLGLSWDEFSRTSELVAVHSAAMQKLVDEDTAYISKEKSAKEPGKTVEIVRLRNPGKIVTFADEIRGEITFDTTELKDFALGRAIDDPLFHFAVVVDDATQGITHVIRGEDHISNTPRQILIQEALGYSRPVYAHYPLLLGADRSKLSKRMGDVAVRSYREMGFLPQALLNYIANVGWTPPSGKEILSLEEMVQEFELKDLHKSGAVFDMEKLRWYNRHYLLRIPEQDFSAGATAILKEAIASRNLPWDERVAHALAPVIRERISVWQDLRDLIHEGEFDFFFSDPTPEAARIAHKGISSADTIRHLEIMKKSLDGSDDAVYDDPERIKARVFEYAGSEGRGAVLWPLRYSLTGREKSPDPFSVAHIIGKGASVRRIDNAIQLLKSI